MSCALIRDDLAAYVLGTLNDADAAAVTDHLATCADCRAEVAEFAPLPDLLRRVTAADIEAATEPVPDLVPRAMAVRRSRRRRRFVLVAAAAVVVAGAGTTTTVELLKPPARQAAIVASNTDPTSHVTARVAYAASDSGTNLWLTLDGVPSNEHCELVAFGPNGRQEVAATWEASYTGDAKVQGMTALSLASIKGFEIKTTDGRHLVWVTAGKS